MKNIFLLLLSFAMIVVSLLAFPMRQINIAFHRYDIGLLTSDMIFIFELMFFLVFIFAIFLFILGCYRIIMFKNDLDKIKKAKRIIKIGVIIFFTTFILRIALLFIFSPILYIYGDDLMNLEYQYGINSI